MNHIKEYFCDSAWYVAFRKTNTPLFEKKEEKARFTLWNNSLRYWCADPFIFEEKEVVYVFMEIYDILKQKGAIGYRIVKDGKVSKIYKCLETPYHLSYPYIFRKNGNIYMLPESYQSNELTLYKAVDFPNKWEKCETLLNKERVCDTDYFEQNGREYLLTTPVYGKVFVYDKLNLYCKNSENWISCKDNPVVQDASIARNAGLPFLYKGKFMRPSQNCSKSYGENITFHQVDSISPDSFVEHEIAKIRVEDIHISNSDAVYTGIHTYNRMGEWEVIDMYCKSVFQPLRFLYLLINKLKRKR